MDIVQIILNASIIAWLFPIIRQFKTRLFYYFLILGLMDPLNRLIAKNLNLFLPGVIFAIGSLLLFFSIENTFQSLLKNWVVNLMLIVICIMSLLFFPKLELCVAIIHLLILYKFIKIAVLRLHNSGEFNFFYLVLVFYELSAIINLIVIASGTSTDLIVFVSTISFQILVAIFFTIFREDSKLLTIQAKIAN